jgi:hypothetical protein
MKILSTTATVINSDGYVEAEQITVCDLGETITIGCTEHNKSDLVIGHAIISSEISGWSVLL